eukprot:jgi/Undpi1/1787/HiC_scaffold_12.g05174.m1
MSQMAISIMSPSDPVDGSEGLIMEVAVGDMLKVCTETTTMSLTFAQHDVLQYDGQFFLEALLLLASSEVDSTEGLAYMRRVG